MKFFYNLPGRWVPLNPELVNGPAYRSFVQAAEAAGFHGACLDEHPAPVLPWLEGGGGHHCLDPFVALAMFAGATTRLKLLTYLAVLPYRNPFMFTKVATTLDLLSHGRLILGVGIGYMEGEYAAMGVDFARRNELFDEAIDVFRRACTGEPVSHEGIGFSARDVVMAPGPVQRPHPPLWLGGNARLTLRRVAEFGQGWLPMPRKRGTGDYHKTPPLENAADLKVFIDYMNEHAAKVGRTGPIDVVISSGMIDRGMSHDEQVGVLQEYRALGVTGMTVNIEGKSVADELEQIASFGTDVIARLA